VFSLGLSSRDALGHLSYEAAGNFMEPIIHSYHIIPQTRAVRCHRLQFQVHQTKPDGNTAYLQPCPPAAWWLNPPPSSAPCKLRSLMRRLSCRCISRTSSSIAFYILWTSCIIMVYDRIEG